jgi:hypothetical protein
MSGLEKIGGQEALRRFYFLAVALAPLVLAVVLLAVAFFVVPFAPPLVLVPPGDIGTAVTSLFEFFTGLITGT